MLVRAATALDAIDDSAFSCACDASSTFANESITVETVFLVLVVSPSHVQVVPVIACRNLDITRECYEFWLTQFLNSSCLNWSPRISDFFVLTLLSIFICFEDILQLWNIDNQSRIFCWWLKWGVLHQELTCQLLDKSSHSLCLTLILFLWWNHNDARVGFFLFLFFLFCNCLSNLFTNIFLIGLSRLFWLFMLLKLVNNICYWSICVGGLSLRLW